jgi:outer membrane lipoprotein carrier protein
MFRRLILAAVFMLSAPAQAQSLAQLKDYYQSVKSLSGDFVQTTRSEADEVLETSSGNLLIQRPDRFRWFYQEPFEQLIVADGEKLWVHDVDLEQVTVRPLDEVLGMGPALLLSGSYQSLEQSFQIKEEDDGWLTLIPRQPDWDFQSIRVKMAGGVPSIIEVDSGLGQATRLELKNLDLNPRIDPLQFRFTPPAGVDVIAPQG